MTGEVVRDLEWPFPHDQFPNELGVVIQRTVLSGELPAFLVIHDADNDWCVGDGVNDPNEQGASVVSPRSRMLLSGTHPWLNSPRCPPDGRPDGQHSAFPGNAAPTTTTTTTTSKSGSLREIRQR